MCHSFMCPFGALLSLSVCLPVRLSVSLSHVWLSVCPFLLHICRFALLCFYLSSSLFFISVWVMSLSGRAKG